MIIRTWRGWTAAPEATAAYQHLLNGTIAPDIMGRGIAGLHELAVLRRVSHEGPVEHLTLMTFEDWTAVTAFAGGDPDASVVPPAARALLDHHDEHSRHYELVARHLPA